MLSTPFSFISSSLFLVLKTNDPIIRSLESQDIKQLYPDNPGKYRDHGIAPFSLIWKTTVTIVWSLTPCYRVDSQVELKKLNHSILVCFLELLDILITNPSSEKVFIDHP
jgi:hypothetical protein